MTATLPEKEIKHRGPRIRGICADAAALGVTPEHLALVLRGKRKSEPLQTRYQALKESQLKERMNENTKTSPLGRAPMPIEFAALQNLQPSFFKTLNTLGLDVVAVRFDASKGSPIWIQDKIAEELSEELHAIDAGQFDSSFFPLGNQWHFFHVEHAKFGAAIRQLKNALAERGLLEISGIYHAESAEFLTEWFPATAAGVNVPIESE